MSSWFTDLAGKAENILNKIDQNAANVLKNDSNENGKLLDTKYKGNEFETHQNEINTLSSIKKTISSNSLILQRTPKKQVEITVTESSIIDEKMPVINQDENLSMNWNQSRRSSCSSRTEGVQTVIECPIDNNKLNISTYSTESDNPSELSAMRIVLAEVKSERESIKKELNELKKQIANARTTEIIASLEEACDRLTRDNETLTERANELEINCNAYIKTISELETSVAKLRESETDLSAKLKMSQIESDRSLNELQQYRIRAQHTLQAKDELIAELKNFRQSTNERDENEMDVHSIKVECLELRKERDSLNEELKMLRNQIEMDKEKIILLENKRREQDDCLKQLKQSTSNALKQESLAISQLEDALNIQSKELTAAREEMKNQQMNYQMKLREKDNELSKLRTKYSEKINMMTPATDDRIYSLTQSLVQKQNSLETITAERNAIRIQLEKLEMQHQDTLRLLRQHRTAQIINVNDTDDAKSMLPNFMRENPFDTRVARRMKRAYSSVDKAGVRLGVFLRRYPLIRILVIIYVAFLHLWVMFVLLSSTPNN